MVRLVIKMIISKIWTLINHISSTFSGLVGFINCLRKEPGGEAVRAILIQDPKAPKFSLQDPFYAKELRKDLACVVLRANGVWGSYRHLPLPPLGLKPVRHIWANQLVRGDLNSICWLEGPIQPGFEHDNLVHVAYSSINFRLKILTI